MAEMKLCSNCAMEYDWEGITVQNYDYCCEACSRGEECTCPQHQHQYETQQPMNTAAASQLGLNDT
jgi:hypothetical protein